MQAAIDELGWVRNDAARQLRQGRNGMLGLVVLDVGNPFFTDVAAGVEHVATTHGRVVLLTNSGEDADREARALRMFESQRLEGLLVAPVGDDVARLEAVRARGTRVVLIDRLASTPGFSSVAVDDRLGGRLAVDHLLAAGHRRIGFVGASTDIEQVANRLAGAQSAVDARAAGDGVRLDAFEAAAMNARAGQTVGEQLVALDPATRPTAVFAANDLLALGLLQSFLRGGLSVPGDIALVGYDDIDYASSAAVPLSSVRQPAVRDGPPRRRAAARRDRRWRRLRDRAGRLRARARRAGVDGRVGAAPPSRQPAPPRCWHPAVIWATMWRSGITPTQLGTRGSLMSTTGTDVDGTREEHPQLLAGDGAQAAPAVHRRRHPRCRRLRRHRPDGRDRRRHRLAAVPRSPSSWRR